MSVSSSPAILDHLTALADTVRNRILLLVDRQELTVSELCSVLQLPQSTVSRHLKTLVEAGWIVSRPDGTRRLYRTAFEELEAPARGLWGLVRDEVAATPAANEDARRLSGVLEQRRSRSREFFSGAAAGWDQRRDELFGHGVSLLALLGLLGRDWTIGDLGCGTGPVAEALAPVVHRVIAVDGADAMLEAARARLGRFDNVELRQGELEALPLADASLDAATLILVLHHVPEPDRALAEVARVLRPGGRLLVTDMLPHDRQEYRQEMGHVWMGFSREQVEKLLRGTGLDPGGFRALPTDPAAKGPTLFAVSAEKRPAGATA